MDEITTYLSVFGILIGCYNKPKRRNMNRMKIEIVPEDFNSGYFISWNDLLCSELKFDWDYLQRRGLMS